MADSSIGRNLAELRDHRVGNGPTNRQPSVGSRNAGDKHGTSNDVSTQCDSRNLAADSVNCDVVGGRNHIARVFSAAGQIVE